MTPKQAKTPKQLPKFANVEEAAEFFDTHSIVDYVDKTPSEAITKTLNEDPGILVPIRLQADVYAVLKERARELHLSPASLARRMLIEKLCSP